MIFQRFRRNKFKRKGQNHCYCSKTVVTVANHRLKPLEGVIWPVLQSSGGKLDRFIVKGVN
jgi:hypothetical protein